MDALKRLLAEAKQGEVFSRVDGLNVVNTDRLIAEGRVLKLLMTHGRPSGSGWRESVSVIPKRSGIEFATSTT